MGVIERSRVALQLPEVGFRALAARKQLDLAMKPQEQTNWCWAAVAAAIAAYYDKPPKRQWRQCEIVILQLGDRGCCSNGGLCNDMGFLELALQDVQHYVAPLQGPLDLEGVAQEIEAQRPIGIRIVRDDRLGHFVVIDGYDDATTNVTIKDPARGQDLVPWATLVQRWTHTYRTA